MSKLLNFSLFLILLMIPLVQGATFFDNLNASLNLSVGSHLKSNNYCNFSTCYTVASFISDTIWSLTSGGYLFNSSGSLNVNESKLNNSIDSRSNLLNTNKSNYWDNYDVASDLNYLILIYWNNITNKITHVLNLTDNINYSAKNVNSSSYWDSLDSPSDLNNKITIQGENISGGTVAFARLPTLTNTHTHNFANITSEPWIEASSEGNLNVNSSDYWINYALASDLNYLILSYWANITNKPTHLSNFTDDINHSAKNVNSSNYWDNYNTASDLNNLITIQGENISSGTVADARIASTIARDSEVTAANDSMKTYVDTKDSSMPNLSYSQIATNLGNWTLDKSSFHNLSNNISMTNITYLLKTITCGAATILQNLTINATGVFGFCVTDATGTAGASYSGAAPWLYNDSSSTYFNSTYAVTQLLNISDQRYNESSKISSMPNLSLSNIVTNIGNWSSDKSWYHNLSNNITVSNITNLIASKTCAAGTVAQNITINNSGIFWYCVTDNAGTGSESTTVDGIYLYNITTAIYLNETKLNATIDLRSDFDTNETTRVDNIVGGPCASGEFIKNFSSTGVPTCEAAAGSGDITSVQGDNIYIYNGSDSGAVNLAFNETKLNLSIAAKVTAAFLQTLLDSIYADIADLVGYVGNWTNDKVSYNTTSQLHSIFLNLSNQIYNESAKISSMPNLSYSQISANIGNWTADRSTYINSTNTSWVISTINVSAAYYQITVADLSCTNCIGATEIAELADADISNTLTCSDLVAGSSVVADAEVDDDITIDAGTIVLNTNTYTGTLGGGNITADSLSGTQIAELADADISNTLTCSDLVAASEVVVDAEVANDISIASTKAMNTTGNFNVNSMFNITASNGNVVTAGNITIYVNQKICFANATHACARFISANESHVWIQG